MRRAFVMRSFSAASVGLWSSVIAMASPSRHITHRESPVRESRRPPAQDLSPSSSRVEPPTAYDPSMRAEQAAAKQHVDGNCSRSYVPRWLLQANTQPAVFFMHREPSAQGPPAFATYRVLPMTSAATAVAPAPGPCHGCGVLLGSLFAAGGDQQRVQGWREHLDPGHAGM